MSDIINYLNSLVEKDGIEEVVELLSYSFLVESREELKNKFGECKLVLDEGGENQGSKAKRVFHFPDQNVFIEVKGFYQSYDGYDWYPAFSLVQPIEKTIIVYE